MRLHRKIRWALLTLLLVTIPLGCGGQGSAGAGGAILQFTVGGKTFTFALGDVSQFSIRADGEPVRQAARVENLFGSTQTATDRPATAQLSLVTTGVRVTPLNVGKQIGPLQSLLGTFDITVFMDSVSSSDPCVSGSTLGTFRLTSGGGDIFVDKNALDIPDSLFDDVLGGSFTMCLQVSGNVDANLDLGDGWGIIFGQSTGSVTAMFDLVNNGSDNIHFLLPGDDFNPSNRVTPGSTSSTTRTDFQIGESITVRAGRNGTVLQTATCPTVSGTNYSATVVYTEGNLTCEAEQSGGSGSGSVGVVQVPINSSGDAALPTDTVGGVDYAQVGVLLDQSPDSPPPPAPAITEVFVDLTELGLDSVTTVYLATQTAFAFDLPNGVKVATFTCEYLEGGAPTTLDLVIGSNTAEWAYKNPTIAAAFGGPPPHTLPTIVFTNPTTIDSTELYDGHTYAASVALDPSRTLFSMSLDLVDADTLVGLRSSVNSETTWLTQANIAMTLEGPSGVVDAPSGDDDEDAGSTNAAEALAGCWRVQLSQIEDGETSPVIIIYDIDADGELSAVWAETEDSDTGATQVIEMVRFGQPNAGVLGGFITNAQQSVSASGVNPQADITFSADVETEEMTTLSINILDAVLSGDPPTSFVSNNVGGSSGDITFAGPATGQVVQCPIVSSTDVVSQEELEDVIADSDFCGEGTGTIMPFIFLTLWGFKLKSR